MNIQEKADLLKQLPNDALVQLMQTGSPEAESWLIASEVGRRNRLQEGSRVGTGAPPTVARQLTQQIGQQQPVPTQIPQPGAQSQPRGLGSMMAQGAPKGYAGGGIVTFKDGGEVRGYGAGGGIQSRRPSTLDEYNLEVAKVLGYQGVVDPANVQRFLDMQSPLEKTGAETQVRMSMRESPAQGLGIMIGAPVRAAAALAGEMATSAGRGVQEHVLEPGSRFLGGVFGGPEFAPQPTKPKAAPTAATRQPPPAATQQLPPAAPVPGSALSGLGQMRGAQIAMPEKPTPAADINIPTRAGELAAYYGEDEYGKALAADLAERRKQAAAAKEKDLGLALIEGGLAGMIAGGESRATFLGTAGKAGLKALEGQKAREAARSEEETTMRKEALEKVGREQTERRGYTTAALGEAKEVAKENREALSKYADRVQETTFKNAELKNTITGYLIQADTQLKSHERALDRADQQQAEADRNAMKQLVILAQKDVEAARGTPDEAVATGVYKELFNSYKSMLPAKPTPAPSVKKGKVVADLSS